MAQRSGKSLEEVAEIEIDDLPPLGKDRDAIVRVRVNQSFFRRRVLSAYGFRCCVTGLSVTKLLVASHIIPWAVDQRNRLNPRNGLCLNALHDRAFDCGLMWIEEGFIVRFSPKLQETSRSPSDIVVWLMDFDGRRMILPRDFEPDRVIRQKGTAVLINLLGKKGKSFL